MENIGQDDVVFIEVLQADHFSGKHWFFAIEIGFTNLWIDISVGQWVGLTPPRIVADTLNLTNETVAAFKKEKQYIVQGTIPNTTAT